MKDLIDRILEWFKYDFLDWVKTFLVIAIVWTIIGAVSDLVSNPDTAFWSWGIIGVIVIIVHFYLKSKRSK